MRGCAAALQCVVGGCNASFASQGGLARHVPSHFSQQSSSKLSSQAKLKEESPSKAGLNKRKKLKNKRRCSLRTYPADSPEHTLCTDCTSMFLSPLCVLPPQMYLFISSLKSLLFAKKQKPGPHTHKHFLVPGSLTDKQADVLCHRD